MGTCDLLCHRNFSELAILLRRADYLFARYHHLLVRCRVAVSEASLELRLSHQHNVRIADRHYPRPCLFREPNTNR